MTQTFAPRVRAVIRRSGGDESCEERQDGEKKSIRALRDLIDEANKLKTFQAGKRESIDAGPTAALIELCQAMESGYRQVVEYQNRVCSLRHAREHFGEYQKILRGLGVKVSSKPVVYISDGHAQLTLSFMHQPYDEMMGTVASALDCHVAFLNGLRANTFLTPEDRYDCIEMWNRKYRCMKEYVDPQLILSSSLKAMGVIRDGLLPPLVRQKSPEASKTLEMMQEQLRCVHEVCVAASEHLQCGAYATTRLIESLGVGRLKPAQELAKSLYLPAEAIRQDPFVKCEKCEVEFVARAEHRPLGPPKALQELVIAGSKTAVSAAATPPAP